MGTTGFEYATKGSSTIPDNGVAADRRPFHGGGTVRRGGIGATTSTALR